MQAIMFRLIDEGLATFTEFSTTITHPMMMLMYSYIMYKNDFTNFLNLNNK